PPSARPRSPRRDPHELPTAKSVQKATAKQPFGVFSWSARSRFEAERLVASAPPTCRQDRPAGGTNDAVEKTGLLSRLPHHHGMGLSTEELHQGCRQGHHPSFVGLPSGPLDGWAWRTLVLHVRARAGSGSADSCQCSTVHVRLLVQL